MNFSFVKKTKMNGKQDICEYNPRCLMSCGLVLDYIKMNLFRNKAVNQHVEVVDSNFTKTEDKDIFLYRGSLQDFSWKKATHESIDVVCTNYNVKN